MLAFIHIKFTVKRKLKNFQNKYDTLYFSDTGKSTHAEKAHRFLRQEEARLPIFIAFPTVNFWGKVIFMKTPGRQTVQEKIKAQIFLSFLSTRGLY